MPVQKFQPVPLARAAGGKFNDLSSSLFSCFLTISKDLLSEKQDLAVDITDIIAVINCENFYVKVYQRKAYSTLYALIERI